MGDCDPVATPADHNQKLTKQMSPISEDERKQMKKVSFRELVGGLQFLVCCTRADISFAVNAVSQFSSDPGKSHWTSAKRILRYLKGTKEMKIIYKKQEDESLTGFSDADWGNDIETRRSTTGYVFMKSGGPIS
ncbi:uncharacterized protein LOC134222292 [Armigeres subalbatus]|uniref:uncharacterized protein LOC134222292 n=1 Tax=Armigeres subalbatus TaxID=124917 RepID=UPI002ED48E2C